MTSFRVTADTHEHGRIVELLKDYFDALDESEARLSELDETTVWRNGNALTLYKPSHQPRHGQTDVFTCR